MNKQAVLKGKSVLKYSKSELISLTEYEKTTVLMFYQKHLCSVEQRWLLKFAC